MKERIISGIVMTLIVVPVVIFGGILFDIFAGLLSVIAFKELIDVKKDKEFPTFMKFVGLLTMLMLEFSNVDTHSTLFGLSYQTLATTFLVLLIPTILYKKKKYTVDTAFYLATSSLLLGTFFNLLISVFTENKMILVFLVLVSCCTDIFALVGGKLIGKHKFTKISPNKTLEGCVSGTIFAAIIASTFYMTLIESISVIKIVPIVILLSVVGQIGDLFFSLIKRENDVKDFSNLIPGHGGILDRLDSTMFVLFAYVYLAQFI